MLSGDEYLAEAQNNQVRELTVQAPRGAILDRDGEKLVTNRTALELQIKANELPESLERRRVTVRSSRRGCRAWTPARDPQVDRPQLESCPAAQ